MKNPFASLVVALAIYFLLLMFFAALFFEKIIPSQTSLEIDSEMIGEVAQHQKSQSKKTMEELEKISVDKKNSEKSREEKLEPHDADAKKEELHESHNSLSQKVPLLQHPLPEIPDELRFEAFNSYAIARFYVAASGDVVKVELLKPCDNPRLNQLLLKSLKLWKFASRRSGFVQEIRVSFRVE